jgi:hypothetical protein
LQYKHPRSIKRTIRSDKPITSVFPVSDFDAEPYNMSLICDIGRERVEAIFLKSQKEQSPLSKRGKKTSTGDVM